MPDFKHPYGCAPGCICGIDYSREETRRRITHWLRWFGTGAQVAGAVLIAANLPVSGWAFVPFLAGSLCWLIAALRLRDHAQAVMQGAFILINLLGIWRWLVA